MEFDFRELVNSLARPMEVTEETGGSFDHGDGGKWKAETVTKTIMAAAFNITMRDIKGYGMSFGEGGTYTTEDIKIYAHEPITIGASIAWKGNRFTVSNQISHADHAKGLRLYVAKRAGRIQDAPKPKHEGEADDEGNQERDC